MAVYENLKYRPCLVRVNNGSYTVTNGTIVNGARSIATQANGFVNKFVVNFQIALNPQIVKMYASGNIAEMSKLTIRGAEYSTYLMLIIGIPLFVEIEFVLNFWLGQVPEHSAAFLRIVMVESLFRTMGNPTITAMHATGKMKMLNLSVGILLLCIVPETYILFKMGLSPEFVLVVNIIPWILAIPLRLYWLHKYTNNQFPVVLFMKQVILKGGMMSVVMFTLTAIVRYLIAKDSWFSFISVCITSLITSSIIVYYWGLNKEMRIIILGKIRNLFNQISIYR